MKTALKFSLLVALALLAACNGEKKDDKRTASGEVLEGTISDDMLPLEDVRSQPPLAKNTGAPGEPGEAEATDAAEDDETAIESDDAEASPAEPED